MLSFDSVIPFRGIARQNGAPHLHFGPFGGGFISLFLTIDIDILVVKFSI